MKKQKKKKIKKVLATTGAVVGIGAIALASAVGVNEIKNKDASIAELKTEATQQEQLLTQVNTKLDATEVLLDSTLEQLQLKQAELNVSNANNVELQASLTQAQALVEDYKEDLENLRVLANTTLRTIGQSSIGLPELETDEANDLLRSLIDFVGDIDAEVEELNATIANKDATIAELEAQLEGMQQPNSDATVAGLIDGSIEELVIPEGTTKIREQCFAGNENLKSVQIPSSVVEICDSAFSYCMALEKVTFAENSNIKELRGYAFSGCEKLSSINIPASVTSLDSGVFQGCNSLTNIELPNGLTNIGHSALSGCGLTELIIPETVTYLGESALAANDFEELVVPSSVQRISNGVFQNCKNLRTLILPETVESMEDGIVGDYTFSGCTNLTNVTLPNNITGIGSYWFFNCTSLPSITIPASVTEITGCAFKGCTALTEMTILAEVPPTLANINAISDATTTIYIPAGTLDAYSNAEVWSDWLAVDGHQFVELEQTVGIEHVAINVDASTNTPFYCIINGEEHINDLLPDGLLILNNVSSLVIGVYEEPATIIVESSDGTTVYVSEIEQWTDNEIEITDYLSEGCTILLA